MGSQISRVESLQLLSAKNELPTIPCLLLEIMSLSSKPEATIHDLSKIIEKDQAVSGMVLKMVNSNRHNRAGSPIVDIRQAVVRLGMTETVNIGMTMSLLHGVLFGTDPGVIQKFWIHAYATAMTARRIAEVHDPLGSMCNHGFIFTAGLMHEIGRVGLASAVDLCYFNDEGGKLTGRELIDWELERYGIHHAEVGSLVMASWGMPSEFNAAISRCDYGDDADLSWEAKVICAADRMAHKAMCHIESFTTASSDVRSMLVACEDSIKVIFSAAAQGQNAMATT